MSFLVAFGIPWAAMLIARARHVVFPEITAAFMAGAAFCSVGGVAATYLDSGRSGLKELGRRCLLYRVSIAWWLFALFTALGVHVVATIIYGLLHGGIGAIKPMELFHEWWLFYVLLQGPLGEELGWRGFLLPRLPQRYSPLSASVILGIVCGSCVGKQIFAISFPGIPLPCITIASRMLPRVCKNSSVIRILREIALAVNRERMVNGEKNTLMCHAPDWLRAVVVITVAALVVGITGGKLGASRLRKP
ncbi:MAG TPA: type II CAAX endopeptidase family protein [Terracidiphilus sp.]|nr:type II CAAX endopeptidase family protein [Terracidiphilus sp.]